MTAYQELCPKFESYPRPSVRRSVSRVSPSTRRPNRPAFPIPPCPVSATARSLIPSFLIPLPSAKSSAFPWTRFSAYPRPRPAPRNCRRNSTPPSWKTPALPRKTSACTRSTASAPSSLPPAPPVIYILLFACALQSCALIFYLFVDAQIKDAGLIRFGDVGLVAWLLIFLVLSAISACVWATMRFARKFSKKER